MKAGDKVLFHFDSSGKRRVRDARVLYVWLPHEMPPEGEFLALEVEFVDEDFSDGSVPTRMQSHVPRAPKTFQIHDVTIPSGSWTLPA